MTVEVLSVYIVIDFMATVVLLVSSYMKLGQLHELGFRGRSCLADHNVVHGKFCSLLIYIGSVRSNRNLGGPRMHFAKELTTCKFRNITNLMT